MLLQFYDRWGSAVFSLLFLLIGLPFAAARLSPVVTVTAGAAAAGCLHTFWSAAMRGIGGAAGAAQHAEGRRLLAQVSDEERQTWATPHTGVANRKAVAAVFSGMGL